MIKRLFKTFTTTATPKPQKLINIKVQYEGTVTPFAFPLHTKLAKNLQRAGAPLQFQCGYACSCGTCPVKLADKDYQKICKDQPIQEKQKKVLMELADSQTTRLSCQLFITEDFEGITLKIQ